jgi:hypothetical protein
MIKMKCRQKYCKYNELETCQNGNVILDYDGRCGNQVYDALKSRECFYCIHRVEDGSGSHINYYDCDNGKALNFNKDNECWEPNLKRI